MLGALTVGMVVVPVEVPVPVPGVVGVVAGSDGLPPPPPQPAISNEAANMEIPVLATVFKLDFIVIPISFLGTALTASNYGR